jgi:hypothetical protein
MTTTMYVVHWSELDNCKWVQKRVRLFSLINAREYAAGIRAAEWPAAVGVCVQMEEVNDSEVWADD